jgi:hypothetical protein
MANVVARNRRTGEETVVSRDEYDRVLRDEGWRVVGVDNGEPEAVEPAAEPEFDSVEFAELPDWLSLDAD